MSKKQGKPVAKPAPVVNMQINVDAAGRVQVRVFPSKLASALNMLDAGRNAVVEHFVMAARKGELDEDGNLKESRIVKPELVGVR